MTEILHLCFQLCQLLTQRTSRDALANLFMRANLSTSANNWTAMIYPQAWSRMSRRDPVAIHVPLQFVSVDRHAAHNARLLLCIEQPSFNAGAAACSSTTRSLHCIFQKALAYLAHNFVGNFKVVDLRAWSLEGNGSRHAEGIATVASIEPFKSTPLKLCCYSGCQAVRISRCEPPSVKIGEADWGSELRRWFACRSFDTSNLR